MGETGRRVICPPFRFLCPVGGPRASAARTPRGLGTPVPDRDAQYCRYVPSPAHSHQHRQSVFQVSFDSDTLDAIDNTFRFTLERDLVRA